MIDTAYAGRTQGRTLIVPGLNGSGPGHWQQYWLRDDPDALLVEQDDWSAPELGPWMDRLVAALHAHPGSTVVAHSLGVVLVVHALTRFPALSVGRALLVAPADVDNRVQVHACFASFVPVPRQRLPFPATVVASRNDPYIAFARAQAHAAAWGARFVDLGPAGHINAESGYGRWVGAHGLLPGLHAPGGRVALSA